MSTASFKYRDSTGNVKEGMFALEDYRLAADHGMRASALLNARYADADPQFGSAFEQAIRYLGIYPKDDPKYGIVATRIKDIMDGTCTAKMAGYQMAGGSIVSPKAPIGGSTPASRVLFPEIVLGFIQSELTADYSAEETAFSQMFAMNNSITSDVWTQPIINVTAPRDQDSRAIAANSMPSNMISISASQTSRAMGAVSIGLQMTDSAMRDASIDLVATIVREQTMGQRQRLLWTSLSQVVTGNKDSGETALTPVDFKATYDSTAGASTVTHLGYLKSLWSPDRIYSWNVMYGTLDAYMAIERRTGRPLMYDPATSTYNTGNEGNYGLNPGNPQLINFTTANPRFLIVPDGVVPADQYVMLDTRYALARVTNVSANYAATEQIVLSRSSLWRWDWSEHIYRFRDDAIKVIDYSN